MTAGGAERDRPGGVSRRGALGLGLALVAAPWRGPAARAAEGAPTPSHGLSTFGDLRYPLDFEHFDWVVPTAPKGGRLVTVPSSWATNQNPSTFNSFNDLILKGDAAVGLGLTHASLMVRAPDEPDAVYGLVARSVAWRGRNELVFTLRAGARFADGSPLTAADVVFSLITLRDKGHPQISAVLREVAEVVAEAPDRVVVRFSGRQGRGLPAIVATQPILSAAWWKTRDFEQSSLEPILGAGPYRVGPFEPGRFVEYERLDDWWAADLPAVRGQWNFDRIRFEMYRERTTAFEAFKAGQYTLREESTSITWATQYDFPGVVDGRVTRIELEDHSPSGAQGWFLNSRREILRDPRVREALGLAFDFEWSNKNLFFGSYRRTSSFFVNSDLEASGRPAPEELALLEPFRARLPAEVFGEAWTAPTSDGSGRDRGLLKRASDLLAAAGWKRAGSKLVDDAGRPFEIEFLEGDTGLSRVAGPYLKNLEALGITARERVVDPSQFEKRLRDFDFDVVSRRYSLSPTPDDTIRQFWHSSSAASPGANNLAGIADPVVDALIEAMIAADSRAGLTHAARALDRVLRAGRWWVPHWYKPNHWIAAWDVFGRPKTKPRYDRAIESSWWIDRDKAVALGKGL